MGNEAIRIKLPKFCFKFELTEKVLSTAFKVQYRLLNIYTPHINIKKERINVGGSDFFLKKIFH